MSDEPITTDDPAAEPARAEVEHRAAQLAEADGLAWAAPGTPEHGTEDQPGVATADDRARYRALARERLEGERGLVID